MRLLCQLAVTILVPALMSAQAPSEIEQARQLIRDGRLAEAEALLRKAVDAGGDSAELHGELGGLLYDANRFSEAVPELGRAAQLDPKHPIYSMRLAGAILGDRRYTVALEFLKAVRSHFDKLPDYHYNVGLAYYGLHNFPSALEAFQTALKIDPKMSRAQFFIGNCQAVMGDLDSAVKWYRQALEAQPGNVGYLLALGKVLAQTGPGGVDESISVLRKALSIKPEDVPTKFALGLSCEQAGDLGCAKQLLEEAAARYPDELEPHIVLARIYARLKDREQSDRETAIVKKLQQRQNEQRRAPTELQGNSPPPRRSPE